MKKIDIKFISTSAIIAALYVGLTWLLSPISYGSIQFRISEVLLLLVVLNPKYAYSLIIGCLIANTTSPLGWYDIVFGTLATTFAILPMMKIKKIGLACIFPVMCNSIIISIELGIALDMFNIFWFNMLTVGLGEAVVLYFLGIPFCKVILNNNALKDILEIDMELNDNHFTLINYLYFIIGALGIIFYIAYPFFTKNIIENDEIIKETYTALKLTSSHMWLCIFLVISSLILFICFTKNKLIKIIFNTIFLLILLILYIVIGIIFIEAKTYIYYYIYSIYLVLYGLIIFYNIKKWR